MKRYTLVISAFFWMASACFAVAVSLSQLQCTDKPIFSASAQPVELVFIAHHIKTGIIFYKMPDGTFAAHDLHYYGRNYDQRIEFKDMLMFEKGSTVVLVASVEFYTEISGNMAIIIYVDGEKRAEQHYTYPAGNAVAPDTMALALRIQL